MTKVSVLIPTFRRTESFLRAARSVFAQRGVSGVELIAIDNSPEGAALDAFRRLATWSPIPFRWAHEPRPGVAHARNAALTLARGELVAWLDDDEEASPDWLASLIAVRDATGAQSVFGPVIAKAPADAVRAGFAERLYTRTGPNDDKLGVRAYGIGNSLQPRVMFGDDEEPFALASNETGGEDDALFADWAEAGAAFAWAARARVTEHLGVERTSLAHGLKRAFAYGQAPSETAWAQRDYLTLTRHIMVGAGQALVFGALAIAFTLAAPARGLVMLERAARGAGKVLFFSAQKFYGAALARQPA